MKKLIKDVLITLVLLALIIAVLMSLYFFKNGSKEFIYQIF